ncbi:MAG: arginine repressor [Firmicutes bacterium]|jgi:transcriptional regulator of arginine metabolism|nr:arginine repressor [Bacillota bacterium]MBR3393907.1 arginine repressor [Bacillota bacterium]
MKSSRQNVILEIIADQEVETQQQLMSELLARGMNCTQATMSRDIKELGLFKQRSVSGKYRYVAPGQTSGAEVTQKQTTLFKQGVISFEQAQNLVVIRTLPGLTHTVCLVIEEIQPDGLVGTLAGDDTAFIAMKDSAFAEALCRQLTKVTKG